MRHVTCRRAVLDDRLTPEVEAHLASCAACAEFARRLREVVGAAPSLAPPPPPGLADRVLARLRTQLDGAAPAVPPPRRASGRLLGGGAPAIPALRRRPGRLILAGLSAAAAAAAVGGLVATRRPPPPEQVLAAATRAMSRLDTARFTFSGRVETAVRLPSFPLQTPLPTLPPFPTPDLSSLPPELRAQAEAQIAEARRAFEAQVRSMTGAVPTPLPETRMRLDLDGSGELALPGRLRVAGTVRPEGGSPQPYEAVVVDGTTYVRAPGGWYRVAGPVGPLGPLVLDPSGVLRAIRWPGVVEDLGTETLDGVWVRHLRFGPPAGTVEAWVGANDHLVRRLRMLTSGSLGAMSWRSEVTMDLRDFGAAVDIEPPPPNEVLGDAPPPQGTFAVVYPFGFSVSAGRSS